MAAPSRADRPRYADLPLIEKLGARHSWDWFGRDDERGTVNAITDLKVVESLAEVRTGERIGLSLEASAIDPPMWGRDALAHTFIESNRNTWDDRLDNVYPQAASQWDSLRHVRAREFGFFGGRTANPPELGSELGIQAWAEKGIITRGVLLDVERHLLSRGVSYDAMSEYSVDPDLLRYVAQSQRVDILPGDVLCVRFGWLRAYRALDATGRAALADTSVQPSFAGLSADESMAEALWDWGVAAVACDNPGAEVSPGSAAVGSLHRRLIPLLGMAVGELLDFDRLAGACAADERWSFLMMSVPLNVSGAVGSPANAVAVR